MVTNTYKPHVGGVATSIKDFSDEYRKSGHRVLIIAPEFDNCPLKEEDVIRVPAIKNVNGSGFSLRLPAPLRLFRRMFHFHPHLIHSHHPYLLGDSAYRLATILGIPLIFTYHTMYEHYAHYWLSNSIKFCNFIRKLSCNYANLCTHLIAPSESIAILLKTRGVNIPISVIPTGIDHEKFAHGDRQTYRQQKGIPPQAYVIGYLGRFAKEKNLLFWSEVVIDCLKQHPDFHALLVGVGPLLPSLIELFGAAGVHDRLHVDGAVTKDAAAHAFHAMDVFLFTSKTETQGIVLLEAMASGLPVVGLDAPGVREVIRDYGNGRLMAEEKVPSFTKAIDQLSCLNQEKYLIMKGMAQETACNFALSHSVSKALDLYHQVIEKKRSDSNRQQTLWSFIRLGFEAEKRLWAIRLAALKNIINF